MDQKKKKLPKTPSEGGTVPKKKSIGEKLKAHKEAAKLRISTMPKTDEDLLKHLKTVKKSKKYPFFNPMTKFASRSFFLTKHNIDTNILEIQIPPKFNHNLHQHDSPHPHKILVL